MKEIKLEEQKQIELDILKYLKKTCEKNNINYFLSGGTLLGAVRHKGFIPWDDDIDILMPHDDYIKFIEIVRKENNDTYKIITPYHNEDYFFVFSRLVNAKTFMIENGRKQVADLGVYIDIFPINKLPNSYTEAKKYCKKIKKIRFMLERHESLIHYYTSTSKMKSILKAIVFFPEHIFYLLFLKNKNIKKYLLTELEKYNNEESNYEGFIASIYEEKDIMRKEVYEKSVNLEFEKELFPSPILYDEYLRNLYGNYIELPPVEKRVPHHFHKVYWK